jgi:hypothetical protein
VARSALLEAHLGMACTIAAGQWKSKPAAVGKWLERAEQLVSTDPNSPDFLAEQTKLCRRAIEACASADGQLDPTPYLETLVKTTRQQIAVCHDPLRVHALEWDLGLALDHALQAFRHRGDSEAALRSGGLATAYLERGAEGRPGSDNDAFHLGQLYYHLGAIHALDHKDHKQALVWFDRATPLLKKPGASLSPTQLGQQGETLVSMAVSYWASDQRNTALELSRAGTEWVEQAVRAGALDRRALAVPYSNLAAIHQALGHNQQSQGYTELARSVEAPTQR